MKTVSPITEFEESLGKLIASGGWNVETPLPTTRRLAEEHRLSNASVHRVLRKLTDRGLLWRHDSGRYYSARAQPILDKPKPLVCLLRQLQIWSAAYRGIMAGVSAACGRSGRSMILTHNDFLVRHPDTAHPPVMGNAADQVAALAQFFDIHPEPLHGFVLDHLWKDEVLARFRKRLRNVVVTDRRSTLDFVSGVFPDERHGAMLALGHLAARGYRRLFAVRPFQGDEPTERFLEAIFAAARQIGFPLSPDDLRIASTPEERAALVAEVAAVPERVALFCPEENIGLILLAALREGGIDVPGRVGLLISGEARNTAARGVSSLLVPFERIGQEAVAILDRNSETPRHVCLPVELFHGATT